MRRPSLPFAGALSPFTGSIKCHGQYHMKGGPRALSRQHEYPALVVLGYPFTDGKAGSRARISAGGVRALEYGKSPLAGDDDMEDGKIFSEAYVDVSTTLRRFGNGRELLRYLSEPAIVLPDLIFLDLNMPRKCGLQVLEEIKGNGRLKNICTVIYSGSDSPSDIQKPYERQADGFIKKPPSTGDRKKILRTAVQSTRHLRRPVYDSISAKEKFQFRKRTKKYPIFSCQFLHLPILRIGFLCLPGPDRFSPAPIPAN